jgi:hypothetical protein
MSMQPALRTCAAGCKPRNRRTSFDPKCQRLKIMNAWFHKHRFISPCSLFVCAKTWWILIAHYIIARRWFPAAGVKSIKSGQKWAKESRTHAITAAACVLWDGAEKGQTINLGEIKHCSQPNTIRPLHRHSCAIRANKKKVTFHTLAQTQHFILTNGSLSGLNVYEINFSADFFAPTRRSQIRFCGFPYTNTRRVGTTHAFKHFFAPQLTGSVGEWVRNMRFQ